MAKAKNQEAGAGGLLVVGFDGARMSPELARMLARIQPAGVILFARNIANALETYQLLKDCRKQVRAPLFTMVDLEGGRVDRFRAVFGPAPPPQEVFETRNRSLYRRHGAILGRSCRALGLNVDLAPVLDLALAPSRAVMGSRAVSSKPQEVIAYARAFLKGLHSAAVVGSAKHFPGLGEASLDSHQGLPVIEKSFVRLWAEDLAPYRALRRELPMTLVNHASYPQASRDRLPASLSGYWITEVLRKKIGYRGLILSDDLEMGGVLEAAPLEEAAVEFVRAGGDLCLICREREGIEKAFELLNRESGRDAKFRRRVAESLGRIAAWKRRYPRSLRPPPAPSEAKVARLSRELWEFSERVRLERLAAETMRAQA
jgi:beta-N-acetylhexosaminidase